MTIGERIAWIRREHGLSQEAFGESLGVSRQAISKWEADSSIPDVDKLIALSRNYHVSVGYILGLEASDGAGPDAAAREGSPERERQDLELSEGQLKMVEEIVGRYLEARPPAKKSRRRWIVLGAVLGLAFLIIAAKVMYGFWQSIEELKEKNETLTTITAYIDTTNMEMRETLDKILRQQDSLLADESCRLTDWDPIAGTVTFTLFAMPRNYVEGMTVVFFAESDGKQFVTNAEESGKGFRAQLTCALSDEVNVFVQVESEGEVRQQLLEEYTQMLENSVPLSIGGSVSGLAEQCHEGRLFSNVAAMEIEIYTSIGQRIANKSFSVQYNLERVEGVFYINDEEYAVYETKMTTHYDYMQAYEASTPVDVTLAEGDILTIAGRATDNYGRVFEGELARFIVKNGELSQAFTD